MKTVLCFGDSNTWGAVPVETYGINRRYPLQDRWPSVLQSELGSSWHVIPEGLPARTTVLGDAVGGEHFSGLSYLKPCMLSHTAIRLACCHARHQRSQEAIRSGATGCR